MKKPLATPSGVQVGILGAGIGGLYAALMLQSVGISYKIIEESNRTGGRLFTHKFTGQDSGEFDYFDVGAMRFPKTQNPNPDKADVMGRLFHLLEYGPLNVGEDKLKDRLIPYHFSPQGGNGMMYFNNIRVQKVRNQYSGDFLWAKMVDEKYARATPGAIMSDVTRPYVDEIMKDLASPGRKVGWKKLMTLNAYSVRSYMSTKYIPSPSLNIGDKPLPTDVVNWCEALDGSTGGFDRSFSEMVLGRIAFGADRPSDDPFEWKCLKGGSQVLSDAIEKYLLSVGGKIKKESRVSSISFQRPNKMEVGFLEKGKTTVTVEFFEDIISTLPLPCLRTLELEESGISVEQANAMRQITYGNSVKIGMRFKSAWWTEKKNIHGGQSSTDRPVRTVVYPSHGDGESKTLIASYCRSEDAQRFGSLIGTGKPEYENQIKEMVIRDLALVHEVPERFLTEDYQEHFAWNWHHPGSLGAFAFFNPGEFELPYIHLNKPAANGHLHFAGEALSTRHAWVVGALDSAWRAVKELIIIQYGDREGKLKKFTDLWGENMEWRAVEAGGGRQEAEGQEEGRSGGWRTSWGKIFSSDTCTSAHPNYSKAG
ncbi:hypothetical protein BD779DRAFT_1446679 [Infundibulicybe gibba]|nr:hypothetical protein BD779DRAFT_1446679 [Infundibulicybe gibba]